MEAIRCQKSRRVNFPDLLLNNTKYITFVNVTVLFILSMPQCVHIYFTFVNKD